MSADTLKTLFHPYAAGMLPVPAPGSRAIFLGAMPGFRLPEGFGASVLAVQGFRPDYLALERGGVDVKPLPEGGDYDVALVLTGRHRGRNEHWLAEAMARTRPGGLIVVAGAKTDGIDGLRKRMQKLLAMAGHASKHHGVAFWLERPDGAVPDVSAGDPERTGPEGRFETAPGMFSFDRVDAGSRLLAEHLPPKFSGRIADFGAGWGYLSTEALKRDGGISGLDLFEADYESLAAAKRNLAGATPATRFLWHDLLSEPVERVYDAVVMNPPFHRDRAADPAMGQGMIAAAAKALKPGGRLYMVANRGLPYEAMLAASFAATRETARDDAFKVLWGRR